LSTDPSSIIIIPIINITRKIMLDLAIDLIPREAVYMHIRTIIMVVAREESNGIEICVQTFFI
jgi:hypothetical protein